MSQFLSTTNKQSNSSSKAKGRFSTVNINSVYQGRDTNPKNELAMEHRIAAQGLQSLGRVHLVRRVAATCSSSKSSNAEKALPAKPPHQSDLFTSTSKESPLRSELDEITKGDMVATGWALAHNDELDYSAKIVFSDDEEQQQQEVELSSCHDDQQLASPKPRCPPTVVSRPTPLMDIVYNGPPPDLAQRSSLLLCATFDSQASRRPRQQQPVLEWTRSDLRSADLELLRPAGRASLPSENRPKSADWGLGADTKPRPSALPHQCPHQAFDRPSQENDQSHQQSKQLLQQANEPSHQTEQSCKESSHSPKQTKQFSYVPAQQSHQPSQLTNQPSQLTNQPSQQPTQPSQYATQPSQQINQHPQQANEPHQQENLPPEASQPIESCQRAGLCQKVFQSSHTNQGQLPSAPTPGADLLPAAAPPAASNVLWPNQCKSLSTAVDLMSDASLLPSSKLGEDIIKFPAPITQQQPSNQMSGQQQALLPAANKIGSFNAADALQKQRLEQTILKTSCYPQQPNAPAVAMVPGEQPPQPVLLAAYASLLHSAARMRQQPGPGGAIRHQAQVHEYLSQMQTAERQVFRGPVSSACQFSKPPPGVPAAPYSRGGIVSVAPPHQPPPGSQPRLPHQTQPPRQPPPGLQPRQQPHLQRQRQPHGSQTSGRPSLPSSLQSSSSVAEPSSPFPLNYASSPQPQQRPPLLNPHQFRCPPPPLPPSAMKLPPTHIPPPPLPSMRYPPPPPPPPPRPPQQRTLRQPQQQYRPTAYTFQ